jgi:FKBP-type peptidyl-prolyl cis-trans isomerase
MNQNNTMNVTGTGIAVAIAVIIALGLLFFGNRILSFFNHVPSQTASSTTVMQDQNSNPAATTNDQTSAANQVAPAGQTAPAAVPGIPANVTQLMMKDLVVGTGAEAKAGMSVTVQYVGMLTNGQTFDASKNHGNDGFTFKLGAGQVIKGWDEGVAGMKVGGKRELVIPASLGYGAQSVGSIPANSTLVFEVELLKVQ